MKITQTLYRGHSSLTSESGDKFCSEADMKCEGKKIENMCKKHQTFSNNNSNDKQREK